MKKTTCIEKLLSLKKPICIENHLHWNIVFMKKITCIEKLLSLKKPTCIEKLLSLKKSLHWKKKFIEKSLTLKNDFQWKIASHTNVAFKIVFGTWWKLMYENFPFPLEKTMKMIILYGLLKPKFWYKGFPHI